jgi:hypothetical protein
MPLAPRADRSKSLGTGDACLRGNAFGYEPVRLELSGLKKLRAITGAVIWREISH